MKDEHAESAANVSNTERLITALAGGFLIYKALSGEKKKIFPAIAGACMVLRATTGYCPIYDLLAKTGIGENSTLKKIVHI